MKLYKKQLEGPDHILSVGNAESRRCCDGDGGTPIQGFNFGSNVKVEAVFLLETDASGVFQKIEILHELQRLQLGSWNCFLLSGNSPT